MTACVLLVLRAQWCVCFPRVGHEQKMFGKVRVCVPVCVSVRASDEARAGGKRCVVIKHRVPIYRWEETKNVGARP